jgi:hypothetical protein
MDPLMPLQIVVSVKGLLALIAFERSVILLLLASGMVSVHLPTHLVLRILHTHTSHKCHLVARIVNVGHYGACHCWQVVAAICWSVALRAGHALMALR